MVGARLVDLKAIYPRAIRLRSREGHTYMHFRSHRERNACVFVVILSLFGILCYTFSACLGAPIGDTQKCPNFLHLPSWLFAFTYNRCKYPAFLSLVGHQADSCVPTNRVLLAWASSEKKSSSCDGAEHCLRRPEVSRFQFKGINRKPPKVTN